MALLQLGALNMLNRPAALGDKLRALLQNAKLPDSDVPEVDRAIERYGNWLRH